MDEEDGRVVVEEELIFEADDEEMAELNEDKEDEPKVVQEEVIEEEEMVPQVQQPAAGNIDLEEGEVAEEKPRKKSSKTLKVHLPDLVKGIDQTEDFPMTTEEMEKLDKRAKRFNTKNPVKATEVTKVYESLGIPPEERERKTKGEYRLEYIQMHGIFALSEEEILDYFQAYSVSSVIDLAEETCIVKFENGLSALRAMLELSKPIGLPKKEERVVKHVLTGSDEPERKVITRDLKEDFDRLVHPDDIPISMPEGKWRLGKEHKKCDAILLRFPKRPDFLPAHYLTNDKYKPNIKHTEPPPEVVEKERELREKNRNFDKKNPWGEVAAEWASPKKGGPREYVMDINNMDNPPARFAIGMRDWDNPENEDESNPTKVYAPPSRKRKIHDRMDFGARETDPTETYFSEGEVSESETEEKEPIKWEGKLKRPRMGMVADIEEAKKAKNMLSRVGLTTKPKRKADARPALVLKRKVNNAKFVVREEVVEELSSEEDDHYLQEARNKDLRHQLTMKIENQPIREKLKPTRKFAERFGDRDLSDLERDDGRDLGDIENMKIEIRRDTSSSEGEDNGMDVDSDEDKIQRRREEPRRRKPSPEVDLRQRMRGTSRRNSGDKPTNGEKALRRSGSGDLRSSGGEARRRNDSGGGGRGGDLRERMSSSARPDVRIKVEKEDKKEPKEEKKKKKSSSKKMEVEEEEKEDVEEEDAQLIEERVKEIELLKKQERKLLEEKERRLKDMERKREEEKQRAKREKEKERDRREKEKEKERERQKQKEKERQEKERQRAKDKLREKERSRRSRKRSETSDDDSSESDSSDSESSESESSESDSSSSSEDSSSSGSDSSSSESESEPEQRRRKSTKKSSKKAPPPPPAKKSADKKKSAKQSESTKSSKSSDKKDKEKESKSSKSGKKEDKEDDQKKAVELRDKLKTYLKKAKDAKDKKDEKDKK